MSGLTDDLCYRALKSRDRRFEGRFFVLVTSTGIYCRPGCPARLPRRENVRFVPTAAAAEAEGFRACKRCRPEAVPGTDSWPGSATVSRALRAIQAGALDGGTVEQLADRCGVGPRHLSRLFQEQLGAPPVAIAQTRRAHFARRLLDQTDLPMTQVAYRSGFASVRRFNTAMRTAFGSTPTELRNGRPRCDGDAALVLRIGYRPPLRWQQIWGFLGPRCVPGLEALTDGCYRRRVRLAEDHGVIEVRPRPRSHEVEIRMPSHLGAGVQRAAECVQNVFDLRADPRVVAEALRGDRSLRLPGVRVPGAFDGFELAVRAVLGQQITVAGATTLAGRLVERYGERVDSGDDLPFLFPSPEVLARARCEHIGMPLIRATAIRRLARAVAEGAMDLSPTGDPEDVRERLTSLPGVGEWTASYVCMRALRHPDAFPEGDLGLRKAVSEGAALVSVRELSARAEAWRPWRAYAAMTLWHRLQSEPSE